MPITNLKDSPHLLNPTLEMIERSFHYEKPHSFAVDFALLMNESNHHNCFVMIDESGEVVAHIGVCERRMSGFPIAMLGGIAVDEEKRGQGFFQELMQDVLAEKRSEVAFFLLWSDLEKLYNKFGFYLCGMQFEVSQKGKATGFEKTKYHDLSSSEQDEIKALYKDSFCSTYLTVERNDEEWKKIASITSADLFTHSEANKITDYFFMNKGQDLGGIIYEYASSGALKELIPRIAPYGKVWLGDALLETPDHQFQFFLSPGDKKTFTEFISHYTKNNFRILEINSLKQEVYFHFNDELLSLETEDFLRGVFGPGIFEEIEQDLQPVFISGLISI